MQYVFKKFRSPHKIKPERKKKYFAKDYLTNVLFFMNNLLDGNCETARAKLCVNNKSNINNERVCDYTNV